jgi:hypothetical protein
VEQPVALSAIQNGLPPVVKAIPQAFCKIGSTFGVAPDRSDVKFVTWYWVGGAAQADAATAHRAIGIRVLASFKVNLPS